MSTPRGSRHVTRPGRPVYGRGASRQPRSSGNLTRLISSRRVGFVISFILAILVIIGIGRLTTLTKIQIQGARGISIQHVQRITQTGLSHQWFGNSLLLFNANSLKSDIKLQEPAIKNLELHRRFPHTLVVSITERRPSLNWRSGGHLYLLDSDGTVIGDSRGEYIKLPTVSDTANLPVKVGDRVAPSSFVTFCDDLARLLPGDKLAIAEMQVPESTSEVYVRTTAGYLIKFDTTRPAAGEVSDLQAVLTALAGQHKAPAQYIDLRIEHKAYYK